MANYLFEQMSESDAANYNASTDSLFFLTGSASTVGVKFTPGTSLTNDSLTLTNGGVTHTFAASALGGEPLTFFSSSSDKSTLAFGLNGATGDNATVGGVANSSARYYALGGDDTINGSVANDTIDGGNGNDRIIAHNNGTSDDALGTQQDYLFGGAGNDTITGSEANDHIYGNSMSTVAGTADGNDSINAGAGKDYVNGNAGNDTINGEAGADRLYGGAGNDTIDGGDQNDYLQGNKGEDSLTGGNGIDELHGGADNDVLHGGIGNDAVFGDNGDDTIYGDGGFDKLTGGAGNDVFTFGVTGGVSDAANTNAGTATTATDHGVTDQIVDWASGEDTINLGQTVNYVAHTGDGVSFSDVSAAQTYAEQLLDAHTGTVTGGEVAAITVGGDTYLFYNSAGTEITGTTAATSIDSVIKVIGQLDKVFTTADFV